jgi:hypothetical protein
VSASGADRDETAHGDFGGRLAASEQLVAIQAIGAKPARSGIAEVARANHRAKLFELVGRPDDDHFDDVRRRRGFVACCRRDRGRRRLLRGRGLGSQRSRDQKKAEERAHAGRSAVGAR